MPPSAFLRELAAGITLTPESRAHLRFTLLGRTLTFTASPWSVRFGRAEPEITANSPAAPIPDDEPPDILAEIAQLSRYAAASETPTVADDSLRLEVTKATGGTPDASEWGFLNPDAARRRAAIAHRQGYGDVLHDLAEEMAHFTAAVVRHHLAPTPETRREVERCGVTTSTLIVAIVRRVTP